MKSFDTLEQVVNFAKNISGHFGFILRNERYEGYVRDGGIFAINRSWKSSY